MIYKNFSKINPLIALCFLFTICLGCAAKKADLTYNTKQAHLRTFGVITVEQPDEKMAELVKQSIDDLYGSRVYVLFHHSIDFKKLPAVALHEAGLKSIDDIVTVKSTILEQKSMIVLSVYNVEKYEKIKEFSIAREEATSDKIKAEFSKHLPDANVNPKSDRYNIALKLESISELEKAYEVLKLKRETEYSTLIQDMDEKDRIDRKITELERLVKQERCVKADKKAVFAIEYDKKGISEDYFRKFVGSASLAKLEGLLKKYTRKPVKVKLHFDQKGGVDSFWLEVRYWPKWYRVNTKRQPKFKSNTRVISFKPYFPLMRRMLKIKDIFAKQVPPYMKQKVKNLNTVLVLTKPCDETLVITVSKGSSGQMLHPYYVRVKTTGFSESTLEAADKKIFNETGMFALGPPKLISGERTVFGVLYDFLEIK